MNTIAKLAFLTAVRAKSNMTLATHGAMGAAVALLPVHPILALTMAFASHFALDALPHWDYEILSIDGEAEAVGIVKMKAGPAFKKDIVRIGADGFLGLFLAALVFWLSGSPVALSLVVASTVLAMLPDFLQFLYGRLGTMPLAFIQKIHNLAHTKRKLNGQPVLGVLSQAALVALIIILVVWL